MVVERTLDATGVLMKWILFHVPVLGMHLNYIDGFALKFYFNILYHIKWEFKY